MREPVPAGHAILNIDGEIVLVDLGPWSPPEAGERVAYIAQSGEVRVGHARRWQCGFERHDPRRGRVEMPVRPGAPWTREAHRVPVIGRVVK